MTNKPLPDFIIIGAMKAGTTSLYEYLAVHPAISPSSKKDTNFFRKCSDPLKEIETYQAYFDESAKYRFEAGTNYAKRHLYADVPERMSLLLPDVKLIYMVRDPVARIKSHYTHNVARGRERRTLADAIRTDANYIQTSRYHYQLEAFLESYKEEQILVVESERMFSEPQQVVRMVLDFIGIDEDYPPESKVFDQSFNTSVSKSQASKLEDYLMPKISRKSLKRKVQKILSPFRKELPKVSFTDDDIELIHKEILPDLAKLRELTGQTFSSWSV